MLTSIAWAGCDTPVSEAPVPPADIKPVTAAIAVNTNVISNNDLVGNNVILDLTTCTAADCNDDNPCTTDTCGTRGCVYKPVTCAPTSCTTRTCNSGTGACEDTGTRNEGLTCDDGNSCTATDVCVVGVCKGSTVSCNDNNPCTTDACDASTGKCTNQNVSDGKTCSDNNVCNGAEVCKAGVCAAGTPLSCDDGKVCTDDTCDPAAGCKTTFNTVACDDGKACTYGEHCAQGTCGGGTAVVCTDDTCNARTCNGTASCTATPKVGMACDDAKDCTFADSCNDQGRCAGQAITCTSDSTTVRACNNTNKCVETPRTGAPCDDLNPCTKDDALRSDGVCVGTAYTCATSACVAANVCDGKGGCKVTAKADGATCDADNNKCTPNDACKGGVCVADAKAVACVAKDCNTVACEPATGNCVYKATSGGECGVTGCYSRGQCKSGVCSGQPKDCSAFDSACSEGICNAETGQCLSGPKPNGTSCATSAQCAVGAVCAFGLCELTPTACPAASGPCSMATCDEKTGMCSQIARPVGSSCDPGTGCTESATCTADGKCIGAPAPNGDPCTTGDGRQGVCAFGSCAASDTTGDNVKDAGPVDVPPITPPKSSSGGCSMASGAPSGGVWLSILFGAYAWTLRNRSRVHSGKRRSGTIGR